MLKTQIVLTNSIDESEKLKSLASFGETTFDKHYMSALELAEYLLQLSGIIYPQKFIQNDELAACLLNYLKDNFDYFKLFTYNDSLQLINTLQDLRYLIEDDETNAIVNKLPNDKFVVKNEAVKKAYLCICDFLKANNLIDEVGVIRFALENIVEQPDINFIRYELSHLKPLELALLNKAAGHVVEETKINEPAKKLTISSYTKAFGQNNEIEDILYNIYKDGYKFDECLIVSAEEANYANTLSNYHDLLECPITIGTGKLITSTGPGKIFALLDDWINNRYHYEYLLNVLRSEFFNLEQLMQDINFPNEEEIKIINSKLDKRFPLTLEFIVETVGRLKAGFNQTAKNEEKIKAYESLIQKYLEKDYDMDVTKTRNISLVYVKKFIDIINKGMSNFIESYSIIIDQKVDGNALGKIKKMLHFEKDYGVPYDDVRMQIYGQKIGREKPQPGSLYFTSIARAASCLRKHLYIVGLSSSNFPGSSKENPLLLDRDYKPFGLLDASNREINNNKDNYYFLLEEAKKYGVDIHLSWCSFNTQSLKAQNSSSVVFETYKYENGDKTVSDFEDEFGINKEKYRIIEYFDNNLLPIHKIGEEIKGNTLNRPNNAIPTGVSGQAVEKLKRKSYSATALTGFATCPYRLFLQSALGVEEEEDIDVFELISAREYGNMAHDLLRCLKKDETSLDDFKKQAEERFKEYFVINPNDNAALVNELCTGFVNMMTNAYDMENNEVTAFREENVEYSDKKKTFGLRVHGFPDKVIDNKDGTYRVVDYKTGNSVRHEVTDIPSMIQCTLYSFILENTQKDAKVTSFEYRYLKNKAQVFSTEEGKTMKDHYNNLTNVLQELRTAVDTGVFEKRPSDDNCKYCNVKHACKHK